MRFLIGDICPVQEFFLLTLFSVGCGGIYGLYIETMSVNFLSRSKVLGAAGISVVIIQLAPVSTERSQSCESIVSSETFKLVKEAFAAPVQAGQENKKLKGARIRIYYPIGKTKLEKKATLLKKKIDIAFKDAKVTVWSKGTFRQAILNKFSSFPENITIHYKKEFSEAERKELEKLAAQLKDFKVNQKSNIPKKKASEDIRIEIGF